MKTTEKQTENQVVNLVTKEELQILLPLVEAYEGLNRSHITPQDYKAAIERFTGKEIRMSLIMNLNRFSNNVDEEDKRLIVKNVL